MVIVNIIACFYFRESAASQPFVSKVMPAVASLASWMNLVRQNAGATMWSASWVMVQQILGVNLLQVSYLFFLSVRAFFFLKKNVKPRPAVVRRFNGRFFAIC
jgi:hypothetical protein